MRKLRIFGLFWGLLWAIAAGLLAPAAFAEQRDAAVGGGGELYTVQADLFGSLFPGRTDVDPATPVLALDIARPGGPPQRLLVPETNGTSVESSPSVVFEDATKTVFLLWETRVDSTTSLLTLASYDGTRWSDQIKILGNTALAIKTSPQMVLTRDSYLDAAPDGVPFARTRTVLHVVWAEQSPSGLYQVFYSPVVLQDGVYLGTNPIYNLNSFDQGPASPAAATSPGLARALTLQGGQDGQSVVAAFTSQLTNRMMSVAVNVLPRQLGIYADVMRAKAIEIGSRVGYPSNRQTMANQLGAAAVKYGGAFQPEVVQAVVARVTATVLRSDGTTSLQVLAEGLHSVIIEIGVRLGGRGVRYPFANSTPAAPPAPFIAEVGSGLIDGNPAPTHLFCFQLAFTYPIPALGLDAGAVDGIQMFVSPAADSLMLAWQSRPAGSAGDGGSAGPGAVSFATTRGGDWTPVYHLQLGGGMDAQHAYRVLEQKVR
ncbi:MAG TPA: hypothetical protein VHR45_04080 [Thermoanaerobaculia bacterium]|nr:hypothetical protein [Thermoanaerobaculia bacterium]